jgi:hypothetical protein
MKWPGRSLRICRICLPRRWISRCLSKLAPSWPCSNHEQLSLILWMVGFPSLVWSIDSWTGLVHTGPLQPWWQRGQELLPLWDAETAINTGSKWIKRAAIFLLDQKVCKGQLRHAGCVGILWFPQGFEVLAVGFGSHSERGRLKLYKSVGWSRKSL